MIPCRQLCQKQSYAPTTDSHGAPVDAWGTPSDVMVYGWAFAKESADIEQGRTPIDRDVDLLVPPGGANAPRDHWILNGVAFEQIGHAEDFTNGPWLFTPGFRINLKRIEG